MAASRFPQTGCDLPQLVYNRGRPTHGGFRGLVGSRLRPLAGLKGGGQCRTRGGRLSPKPSRGARGKEEERQGPCFEAPFRRALLTRWPFPCAACVPPASPGAILYASPFQGVWEFKKKKFLKKTPKL